ncbi:MAG TPA: zf-HC2 domain-containing protein [Roseiflexaceae bacterium]|nr:zf-HC2 domain-containing protein [Roseiflexaceae bacterium]
MMHPDPLQLAAYLDGALGEDERAELRAHVLTCSACAARLERLRADARQIAVAMSAAPAPDVRAAVRARLSRPAPFAWLGGGLTLAGALAALLLFAVLVGGRGAATAGRAPDRLVIADRSNAQIVALDAANGARLAVLKLAEAPDAITYDEPRDRLYVRLRQALIAVDLHTFQPIGRWDARQPFAAGAGMALDPRVGRLYLARPGGVIALALDSPELSEVRTYDLGQTPGALAISPDGATLLALNEEQARLWTIDVGSGRARSQTLAPSRPRNGYLSVSRDGRSIFVLLTGVGERGDRPGIWRVDRAGQAEAPTLLAQTPLPWDMELLDTGQLAIPRGDGRVGGVELVAADTLSTTTRLEPSYDQHHIVAGPNGTLYGLNYTHATITRFDANTGAVIWRTPENRGLVPWDGVYVRGGWRWPWWP